MAAPRLRRAAIRVPEELLGELAGVVQRLHDETGDEYPAAAVVRGLLVVGLAEIAGRDRIAPSFVGTRIARGRKRGDGRQGDDGTREGGRR